LALALAAALWLGAPLLERIEWTRADGDALGVALVQGNVAQNLKWVPGQLEEILDTYSGLSEPLWGTALVVWPESAVPAYLDLVVDRLAPIAARAHAAGSALLLGVPTRDTNHERRRGFDAYNSVAVLGEGSGLYHKRRMVPFGEYVPLERGLRGLIAFFDLPMSNFSAGPPHAGPTARARRGDRPVGVLRNRLCGPGRCRCTRGSVAAHGQQRHLVRRVDRAVAAPADRARACARDRETTDPCHQRRRFGTDRRARENHRPRCAVHA
jgi:hypothetical protein